jgi:hypothetical protein
MVVVAVAPARAVKMMKNQETVEVEVPEGQLLEAQLIHQDQVVQVAVMVFLATLVEVLGVMLQTQQAVVVLVVVRLLILVMPILEILTVVVVVVVELVVMPVVAEVVEAAVTQQKQLLRDLRHLTPSLLALKVQEARRQIQFLVVLVLWALLNLLGVNNGAFC